jgi:hypothetical protein
MKDASRAANSRLPTLPGADTWAKREVPAGTLQLLLADASFVVCSKYHVIMRTRRGSAGIDDRSIFEETCQLNL